MTMVVVLEFASGDVRNIEPHPDYLVAKLPILSSLGENYSLEVIIAS